MRDEAPETRASRPPPCLTPSPVRDPHGVHSPGLGGQHEQVTPSRFTGSLPDTAMWGGRAGCKQGTGEKRRKRVGRRAETCKLCSPSQDGASLVSGRAKGVTPSNVLLSKRGPWTSSTSLPWGFSLCHGLRLPTGNQVMGTHVVARGAHVPITLRSCRTSGQNLWVQVLLGQVELDRPQQPPGLSAWPSSTGGDGYRGPGPSHL